MTSQTENDQPDRDTIPHILPGDMVTTPDGKAIAKVLGDGTIECRHLIRNEQSPGAHATQRYVMKAWPAESVRRLIGETRL